MYIYMHMSVRAYTTHAHVFVRWHASLAGVNLTSGNIGLQSKSRLFHPDYPLVRCQRLISTLLLLYVAIVVQVQVCARVYMCMHACMHTCSVFYFTIQLDCPGVWQLNGYIWKDKYTSVCACVCVCVCVCFTNNVYAGGVLLAFINVPSCCNGENRYRYRCFFHVWDHFQLFHGRVVWGNVSRSPTVRQQLNEFSLPLSLICVLSMLMLLLNNVYSFHPFAWQVCSLALLSHVVCLWCVYVCSRGRHRICCPPPRLHGQSRRYACSEGMLTYYV